jgi:hypothetical protein
MEIARGIAGKVKAEAISNPCLRVNLNDDLLYLPIINQPRHRTHRPVHGAGSVEVNVFP